MWNKFISASKIRNFLYKSNIYINDLPRKGRQFEIEVVGKIKEKFMENEFKKICNGIIHNNVNELEKNTLQEILIGTPIIYQPLLMNRTGPLAGSYGVPDFLIRSDYLKKLVTLDPLPCLSDHQAPKLNGNYHYVIVDVKFNTIVYLSDGECIENTKSIFASKHQLYIYNHALGQLQGYEPDTSFILAKNHVYKNQGLLIIDDDCFSKLGHINYKTFDMGCIDRTIFAIESIKKF